MAERPEDPGDDYTVGYKKPPQSTRFKEGTSGNPKGRPKGSKNLMTIILKEGRQQVRLNGPHGTRKVSKLEASVMQLSNKAAQGDLRATKEFFGLVRQAEVGDLERGGKGSLPEADQKTMESIRKRLLAFAQAPSSKEDE